MRIEPEEINTKRSSIALELMSEGKEPLQISNLSISNSETVLLVSTWSSENTNMSRAISDIEQGRRLLSQLCAAWPELSKHFGSSHPVIKLFDDYGMGAVLLGSSPKENEYTWHASIAT
ncbi:hypothetical protein [Gilvimarinus agarilyticus]|uniref:hypothetical protein n=1 Tax=Gilvimarinus agarilyticus TaxID=679259 RepID=UPI0005A1B4FB|nr:hypothetical protein [Gilvimarinus agarilyticus]